MPSRLSVTLGRLSVAPLLLDQAILLTAGLIQAVLALPAANSTQPGNPFATFTNPALAAVAVAAAVVLVHLHSTDFLRALSEARLFL